MNKIRHLLLCTALASLSSVGCSIGGQAARDAAGDRPQFSDPVFEKAWIEIDRKPDSPQGYLNLAMLYMKESRRTGDFSLNGKAQDAVSHALELDPNNLPARKLEASLHLAHHRFSAAIDVALKLRDEVPSDSFVLGVLADAYVETGEYEKAIEAAQKMVDLKPGTASYSRAAQLRSLHGEHKGAVQMFLEAARSADPNDKETQSWCLVQLGDEYWKNGKYKEAERVYDEALANYPSYFLAMVSKGRVRASMGDLAAAEKLLTDAQAKVPNANAILLLGNIYELRGEAEAANRQYELFDAMQEKLGDAADHKRLVLSWADRGQIDKALDMAEDEYAAEKSIHSANLLAWTLYRKGNAAEAKHYIAEAMRLKTNDARMLFHAGMIEKELGNKKAARLLLKSALATNPAFDLVQAPRARAALNSL